MFVVRKYDNKLMKNIWLKRLTQISLEYKELQ